MAHINFIIPQSKNELLSDNDVQYYVRNVVSIKEIQPKLGEARLCYKDEGSQFILENFDTFYSVLHHADTLQMDVLMKAYCYLQRAVENMNNEIGFQLEDLDSLTEEMKMKYLNVIKMLLYIYSNIVTTIEYKMESKRTQSLQKGRSRKKNVGDDQDSGYNKKSILLALNNVIQREINLFWDPPVIEETFVNMVAEVCYMFLESPTIKVEKEIRLELFNMLGTLIKSYNHGLNFVVRIVQLIKIHEHLVPCVPEGIQILVQNYNCKSLVRDFVREITEWQTDEKYQNAQGARHCSNVLFEMANLMPDLMIPEVMYLNRYLAHDSYTLRNSVLHVISEVVLTVLTKSDLTEEQRESRDEFLGILEEHIYDTSAHVRSKVFQQWARLQQENAIPVKIQAQILEKAVTHLRDKAANVRKCAANCVTTFLSHNIYGAQLQLDAMEAELQQKKEVLDQMKQSLEGEHFNKLKEVEEQWLSKEDQMKVVIKDKFKEGNAAAPTPSQIAKKDLPELIRIYILEDKYTEAFEICWNAATDYPEWMEAKANLSEDQQVDIFLMLIRAIFTDIKQNSEAEGGEQSDKPAPDEKDLKRLESLANTVEYLTGAVDFLKLIDSAIKPMADLLESASMGDMQESIEFFIAAYQFNINNALAGVLEMLKIMQRNEKERRDLIINAFKTIYLTTDSTNMREHTTTIVERLIKVLQMVPFENLQDLNLIIAEWVSNGILDNSIIDMLWQYFTKKVEVSNDQSRAALYLLMMAAKGRKSIASKNIKLVATVAFGERGKSDPLLVAAACQMLTVTGLEKQDITDKNPLFKVKADDPMWKDLTDILMENFFAKHECYNAMMSEAIDCIYRLCSKPEKICEGLLQNIINSLITEMQNNADKEGLKGYLIAQCAHVVGEVAVKQLNFLDECVYKELKRRNYIREENKSHKKKGKGKPIKPTSVRNASASSRFSKNTTNQSLQSVGDESSVTTEESILEGAQAEDTDAEFILNVLENNTVTGSCGLGKLAYLLLGICERPHIYDDLYVQGTTITALLRYMTVSSRFCEKNIQLLFTILEKTKFYEVKCSILIHCSDLLERFPNIVEPWTPRLYERLRDDCVEVRTAAFFMLANLILRDMIRVQGHISEMACCIVDNEEHLKDMSKNFFTQLSHKANNLYNILPDIFSHLSEQADLQEDDLRFIMKFLFGLVDKNKQMENLVDRFCSKFRLTDEDYKCRNIAYCLSLIQYNEKGLRRLLESFGSYKNTLQNDDVYALFKQILSSCSKSAKNEIKEIAAEIEEKINSVFETNEDGQPKTPRPAQKAPQATQGKTPFKKPRGRAPKKKQKRKSRGSDSDDSPEEEEKENATPVRKSNRTKRTPQRKAVVASDSDSD